MCKKNASAKNLRSKLRFLCTSATTWLTAVSSHCLTTLPAKMPAFSSYMRQNAYHRDLKRSTSSHICYHATKANRRTIRSRVSQPASASKQTDLVNCKLITACYQNSSVVRILTFDNPIRSEKFQ